MRLRKIYETIETPPTAGNAPLIKGYATFKDFKDKFNLDQETVLKLLGETDPAKVLNFNLKYLFVELSARPALIKERLAKLK